MSTPAYNQVQQVFSLNWLSNVLANVKLAQDQLQPQAAESIKEVLANPGSQALIGEWETVWGPVVFSNKDNGDKSVADNTMYLAKSKTSDCYVLAIAGTNPSSPYGWFVEDFKTNTTQPWPFVENAEAANIVVSTGTYVGIQHLLQMKDGDNSLFDYLTSISNNAAKQTELIVTGHSLGGALSPSMALALRDTQTKGTDFPLTEDDGSGKPTGDKITLAAWDANLNFVVSTFASAGPTPGNDKFAYYYDQELGSRTIRLWNNIDVVPHAWQKNMMIAAPFLYEPEITPGVAVLALTGLALANSLKSEAVYTQIMEQIPGLPGKVNTEIIHADEIKALIEEMGEAKATKLIESILKASAEKLHIKEEWLKLFSSALASIIVSYLMGKMSDEIQKLIEKLPEDLQNMLGLLHKTFNNVMLFLVQLGYQHVQAYILFIGIEAFSDIINEFKPKSANVKETEEDGAHAHEEPAMA